jgi:small subunit ribosomal protein S1
MKEENKKSRVRLTKESKEKTKKKEETLNTAVQDSEYFDSDGNFQWDSYEASCPSAARKQNPHIKPKRGERIYSRESYAQELYKTLDNFEHYSPTKPSIEVGEIHAGLVYGRTDEVMSIDVGYRELVYVKRSKEPEELRNLEPGEETSVLITSTDSAHVDGSISGGIKQRTFIDLREGIESGSTAWVGKVCQMIENGGYIVDVQGIECFMPGSLAGINKLSNFESIIGKELYVVPVSFSAQRGTVVVSHRKYLQALIPREIDRIKENIGEELTGSVTGTAKYGVFVEFNQCLTGMIHKNDLNEETFKLFKEREIKPGDTITFKVKEVVSNTKITLTQKDNAEINPWHDIQSRYKVPCIVKAQVKTKKDYGLFVKIEDGVAGLLHISEIGDELMKVFNTGDEITVKINRIEEESQRIFLKLP